MKNSTLVRSGKSTPSSDGSYPPCDGIQFDDDICTPEEQHLEFAKRKILRKLLNRLGPQHPFAKLLNLENQGAT